MTMRKIALAALLATPLLASANLVTNGGFEAATPSTDWSSTASTAFLPISAYDSCCSLTGTYTGESNAAFFGGSNETGGTIWQDLTTVAGTTYVVSFAYGAIVEPTAQSLRASAIGSGNAVLSFADAAAVGTTDRGAILTTYSFSFKAAGEKTRLLFADTSLTTTNVDGVLDNVSVTAVPEPETYALMLAGLCAVGFIVRRRKAL
jgi:hypothetical protein